MNPHKIIKEIVDNPDSKQVIEGFDAWLKARDPAAYERFLPLKKASRTSLASRYLPQMVELTKLMAIYLKEVKQNAAYDNADLL